MSNCEQDWTLSIIGIIQEAGKKLNDLYKLSVSIEEKSPKDYVTSADIEIDNFLKDSIFRTFGNVPIYSEEQNIVDLEEAQWIIDPIDGTSNFILGIPHYSISVAYVENSKPIAGFVYNPATYEMYWTDPWSNAFLNGHEITVSNRHTITEMYGLFGFSANYENITRYYNEWPELFLHSKKSIGILSPSLSICAVAKGKADFFIDFGCSVEGKIAAAEILRKAGGEILDYDRKKFNMETIGIIATNKGKVF